MNSSFKYKYLKYKNKYLKLKNLQKGGNKPNIIYLKNINLFSSKIEKNYLHNQLFNNYKANMEKYLNPIMGCIWSINALENIYRYDDENAESALIKELFMENAGDISVSKIYSYGDIKLSCCNYCSFKSSFISFPSMITYGQPSSKAISTSPKI